MLKLWLCLPLAVRQDAVVRIYQVQELSEGEFFLCLLYALTKQLICQLPHHLLAQVSPTLQLLGRTSLP